MPSTQSTTLLGHLQTPSMGRRKAARKASYRLLLSVGLAGGLGSGLGCDGSLLDSRVASLRADLDADCPPGSEDGPGSGRGFVCEQVPAAYVVRDAMTGAYGNYDLAARQRDGQDIRYIVIHTTEVSYEGTLRIFADPFRSASAHYLIRSSDGRVTKFVSPRHVAWHAGNWYYNMHSIGIEHEAYSAEGHAWFTDDLYESSAALVRYLAKRYSVPLDREHIIGHDEVPGLTQARQPAMHWDPGPYWNWDRFMRMVRDGGEAPDRRGERLGKRPSTGPDTGPDTAPDTGSDATVISLHPDYATNQPPLSYCYPVPAGSPPDCRAMPPRPSNFVYLRESPSDTAPLIKNPYFPTTAGDLMYNWGNKLGTGRYFYRVERKGDWDAIYFGGEKAWFKNPARTMTRVPQRAKIVVTPKTGGTPMRTSIPVFGGGYPADAAYPPPTVPQRLEKIYDMPVGQRYVAQGPVTADYYWAKVYADTLAASSHRLVFDRTLYYQISWNHRLALVRAEDVDVVPTAAPLVEGDAHLAPELPQSGGALDSQLDLRELR